MSRDVTVKSKLFIQRKYLSYIMQTFFPSMMVVIVSMGSLFVPMDQVGLKRVCTRK